VIEAMACGLPVVAARAAALPETVAGAGLTFTADDPSDLERQVRRLLPGAKRGAQSAERGEPLPRVAIVSVRYGTDFVGGAERSLRLIANTLHGTGCTVEVFTTSARSEAGGIPVHCFHADAVDEARQRQAVGAILEADGRVPAETERLYLEHSIRSAHLLKALRERIDEFDAVIVVPYLYGLAFDIALAVPAKTLLLPCFHDEPFSRLHIWREAYREVGGILYHSQEEKELAEVDLGLNHPGAVCAGTFVDMDTRGDAERGRMLVGGGQPYIVYCGRYLPEKNLPALLDFAHRYEEANPGRFRFVFLGEGEVAIPRQPWARDLGFVDEDRKRDVLAGAAALAQLSRNESLSLVALEAWTRGVPVLAAADCAVSVGHLRRGGGGRTVDGYPAFAAALTDLWQHREVWQRMGQAGREYVRQAYGSRENFAGRLLEGIRGLTVPLIERMRHQGLLRAAQLERSAWRDRFGRIVEELLDSPPRPKREQLEVRPRTQKRVVSAGSGPVLVPVRIANRGTHAALSDGPGRVLLRSLVVDELGQSCGLPGLDTPLPGLLVPGQLVSAAMRVPVPAAPGTYHVALFAVPQGEGDETPSQGERGFPQETSLRLIVEQAAPATADRCCAASLQVAHQALAEAEGKQCLPVDYLDVTQGFLAKGKHWLKRKLLGNFKHAYVDVLSRQQSAFNRQTVSALQELAECCALLDHALVLRNAGETPRKAEYLIGSLAAADVSTLAAAIERTLATGKADEIALLLHNLAHQLAEAQQRFVAFEARLSRLEKHRHWAASAEQ